jgi:DNA-binding MarR family transcriptional regulator
MQENLGLLIAAARRRIKQAVLSRLAERRLSSQQFWFTIAIREQPGISQAELAHRVRADAPTASRLVAAMGARGLVRSEPDPGDRRRARVFLTARGEQLARELAPIAREVRDAIVAGMSEGEVEAVRTGLRRVIDNLDRFDAGGSRFFTSPQRSVRAPRAASGRVASRPPPAARGGRHR